MTIAAIVILSALIGALFGASVAVWTLMYVDRKEIEQ